MNRYVLGNCLRGSFEGKFSSIDEAWEILSARFLQSFPAEKGRHVIMRIEKENEYGLSDLINCKTGITSLTPVSDEVLKERADYSPLGCFI